jgi:NAD(P)-dependent dehydrogenase (short-subunit alcohol dehydrogenase family)
VIDLNGKRVLIAGGTGNVGRHLVREALTAGATAIVPSRKAERLQALRQEVEAHDRSRFVPLEGDLSDEHDAPRLLRAAGPLDGAVASLGGFVPAPTLLGATKAELQRALDNYTIAHFAVAHVVIPLLRQRGGAYLLINGFLAFDASYPGTGLVAVATAAQAMLARILARETADSPVRVNELVIYSSFGWGNDDANVVTGTDIGRYVTWLLSDRGAHVRGDTHHLRSLESVALVA